MVSHVRGPLDLEIPPGPMKIFLLESADTRINLITKTLEGKESLTLTVGKSYEEAIKVYEGPYDLLLLTHDLENAAQSSPASCSFTERGDGAYYCDTHFQFMSPSEVWSLECPVYKNSGSNFCRWFVKKEIHRDTDPDIVILSHNVAGAKSMMEILKEEAMNVLFQPYGVDILRYLKKMHPKRQPLITSYDPSGHHEMYY